MASVAEGGSGIVVLGAGYGGLRAALTLSRMEATRRGRPITLVDRGDAHQLLTEIHRVATGHVPAEAVVMPLGPLLERTQVRFVQGEVTALDLAAKRVLLADGQPLSYSHLVVALGSEVDDHGVPGMREHALGLKSVDDARRIWAHLQAALEAAGRETGAEERAALETIVVVGAGWTGTELAGELASLRASVRRTRPPGGSVPRIILLDASETIMPGFSRALAGAARRFFAQSGVDVQLRRPVVAVERDRALLEGGAAIAARTVIWTAGIHGVPAVGAARLPLVQGGRVRVDTYLRAEGHEDVWVVGDSAVSPAVEGVRRPGPSAQLALHQGEVAAANLAATLSGRSPLPYRPFLLGEALSLGESDGAAIAGPFQVHGRRALALKRAITLNYVRSLDGVAGMLDALGGGL